MPGREPAVAEHELAGAARLHIDYKRALQIAGEQVIDLVDDDENLSAGHVPDD